MHDIKQSKILLITLRNKQLILEMNDYVGAFLACVGKSAYTIDSN